MKSSSYFSTFASSAEATIRRTEKVPGRYRSPRDRRARWEAKRAYRSNMFWYRRAVARESRLRNATLKIQRTGRNTFGAASRWIAITSAITSGVALVLFGVPSLLQRWMSTASGQESSPGACMALTDDQVRSVLFSRAWFEGATLPSGTAGCSVATPRFLAGWILILAVAVTVIYLVKKLRRWDPITTVGWGATVLSVVGIAVMLAVVGAVLLAAVIAYAIVITIGYLFGIALLVIVLDD